MTIYDEMKPIANELLTEFNQGTIKYINVVAGVGDVDEPGLSVETEYSVFGTVRGVKFKYVQQGFAVATDLQSTISTIGLDSSGNSIDIIPSQNDFLVIDGIRHKIVEILPKPAAGVTVANVLIIRK